MPFAVFTRVRGVSSEDTVHLAENLINSLSGKKWKTKNVGEKSAYVILEMSGSYQITGIDIGNEHSAFVEVLVGKSSCGAEEFKEILITSSFMTPTESKSSNNINRVRCFNRDALVPTIAEEKWSLLKILCTQPFNNHVSYGLSFIKVHINDNTKNSSVIHTNVIPEQFINKTTQFMGNLKFRDDSSDSESENSSSLFNRWKKSKQNNEQSTAALIRMSSKTPVKLLPHRVSDHQKTKHLQSQKADNILDRNREEILFGDECDDVNNKNSEKLKRLSEHIEVDKKRRRMELEKEKFKKPRESLDSTPSVSNLTTKPSKTSYESIGCMLLDNTIEQESKNKNIKPSKNSRPFNRLLKDVVLVISGIQNPDRADLRSKAIGLGAKYKADWDDSCTHLICAFKNTPKYNQVRGKGKIVTSSWIEKCFSLRKYLPWRRYALDTKELSKPESDEEVSDDRISSPVDIISNTDDLRNVAISIPRGKSEKCDDSLASYNIDNMCTDTHLANIVESSSSENDTEDEIERAEQNNYAVKRNVASKIVDIYEVSTEEEDYINEKHKISKK